MPQIPVRPGTIISNAPDRGEYGPVWDIQNDHLAFNVFDGTPWHEMGTSVHGAMNTEEAVQLAKLDWEVKLQQGLRLDPLTNETFPVKGSYYVVRSDNGDSFANVTGSYEPLQNRAAFSFLDSVLGGDGAQLATAGYINGGRRVWLLAYLPTHTYEPMKGDVVMDYLLLMNSHDGSSSVQGGRTPIRVVCRNTLNRATAAVKRDGLYFKINHVGNVEQRMQFAADLMARQERFWAGWKDEVAAMVAAKFTAADAEQFVIDIVQGNRIRSNADYRRADNVAAIESQRQLGIAEKLAELIEDGAGTDVPGVRGTGWGLYNAVTEWVDHYAITDDTRGRKNPDRPLADRQLQYMLLGAGAQYKERARVWVLEGREAALAN